MPTIYFPLITWFLLVVTLRPKRSKHLTEAAVMRFSISTWEPPPSDVNIALETSPGPPSVSLVVAIALSDAGTRPYGLGFDVRAGTQKK